MRRSALLFVILVACGGGGGSSGNDGGGGTPIGQLQQGVATYYDATGAGACSFPASPQDLDVAAMDQPEWDGSAACGACVKVDGPKGSVTVRIVDLCPECPKGHLDLSQQAFAKIADLPKGKVPISWQIVPCAVTGNIQYQLKDGSSQWWTAFQVRNHRVPVRSFAYQKNGSWVDVKRESYNYFVVTGGTGPAPVRVRATSWDGVSVEDTIGDLTPLKVYPGSGQL
jgi:expansin (peptidoglycan-binding protein)